MGPRAGLTPPGGGRRRRRTSGQGRPAGGHRPAARRLHTHAHEPRHRADASTLLTRRRRSVGARYVPPPGDRGRGGDKGAWRVETRMPAVAGRWASHSRRTRAHSSKKRARPGCRRGSDLLIARVCICQRGCRVARQSTTLDLDQLETSNGKARKFLRRFTTRRAATWPHKGKGLPSAFCTRLSTLAQ